MNLEITSTSISSRDLSLYCDKISSLFSAGIDISSIMNILEEEANSAILSLASKEIDKDINMGESLSSAFKNTGVFPNILINMIKIGEETGEFDSVFSRMAEYFDQKHRIKDNLKKAMIYPMILLSLTFVIWIFLLTFIVPRFKDIFIESNINLPIITKIIIKLSDLILNINILIFMGVVIGLMILIAVYRDRVKDYMFGLKMKLLSDRSIFRKRIILDIVTPLSMMYKTAIPLVEIFENIKETIEIEYLQVQIDGIILNLKKGGSLSKSLEETGLFSKMVTSSVSIGEESGKLDEILIKLTEYYESDLTSSTEKLLVLVEPILILFIGLIIGSMAIGLIIPIVDLMNSYI